MYTKHISFQERPDRGTLQLVLFPDRVTLSLYRLEYSSKPEVAQRWILYWMWSVECALSLFFFIIQFKLRRRIVTVFGWTLFMRTFFLLNIYFFSERKKVEPGFYKGTKPKSLRSFPVWPTMWSSLFSPTRAHCVLVCQWVYSIWKYYSNISLVEDLSREDSSGCFQV